MFSFLFFREALRLDHPTRSADPEAVPLFASSGDHQRLASVALPAKVDFAQRGLSHEFETELFFHIRQPVGFQNIFGGVHIHVQVPSEKGFFTIVALVAAKAPVIFLGSEDLPQLQHRSNLPDVRPSAAAAPWATARMLHGAAQFRVRTVRAQPPLRWFRNARVDLVDHNFPALGVEGVFGRELGDRGSGGAHIFINIVLVFFRFIGLAVILSVFSQSSIDDRFQRHTGLRERIVREQSLVGQEVVDVLRVDRLLHLSQRADLFFQVFHFLLPTRIGGERFNFRELVLEGCDLGRDRFALRANISETDQNPTGEAAFALVRIVREGLQFGDGLLFKRGAEQAEKTFEQTLAFLPDESEQIVGENVLFGMVYVRENVSDRFRNALGAFSYFYPSVEAKGEQLTLQHSGCVEEHGRGFHLAGDHLFRLFKEVHIVGNQIRSHERQRVSVTSARSPDTLEELRLSRWYRAQRHRREVPDVDSQFQRRCAGKQVHIPTFLLSASFLEPLLHVGASFGAHQRRMLGRVYAADIAVFVQPAIEVVLEGLFRVAAGASRMEAGQAEGALEIVPRDR